VEGRGDSSGRRGSQAFTAAADRAQAASLDEAASVEGQAADVFWVCALESCQAESNLAAAVCCDLTCAATRANEPSSCGKSCRADLGRTA